ncbi:MAG: hypothetical protein NVS4B8_20840 [Herpetosiphon sp.]
MPIHAIIFDLDNTLYPASSGLILQVERRIHEYVMRVLGVDETTAHALCKHYYATYGTTLRGLQQHHGHVEFDAYLNYIHDVAVDQWLQPDSNLAAHLAALPLRKIVWTNSVAEYAGRVLDRLGIVDQFEAIFDVRFFKLAGKPDPAGYANVLSYLNLPPAQVIMVDDSLLNLAPARLLGMTVILVDENNVDIPGVDYVVPDVESAIEVAHRLAAPPQLVTPA